MASVVRFFRWAFDGVGKITWIALFLYWGVIGAALFASVLLGEIVPNRRIWAVVLAGLALLLARWFLRRAFLAKRWI